MFIDWSNLPSEWKEIPMNTPGVYFFIENGAVAYIGKSRCLRSRLMQHRTVREEFRSGQWTVRYCVCSSVHYASGLELDCIVHYQPPRNRTSKKRREATQQAISFPRRQSVSKKPPNLGEVLRGWRLHKGLDRRKAAKRIGIPAFELFRVENATIERRPTPETMEKVMAWICGATQ